MNKDKCMKVEAKASFTVEAALLMPLILFAVFTTITLCLYIHNRAWYTAAAYEAAVSQSTQNTKRAGDKQSLADQKIKEANNARFPGSGSLKLTSRIEEKEITVTMEGQAMAAFGGRLWNYHSQCSSKIIKPAAFIRTIRQLEALGKELKGIGG